MTNYTNDAYIFYGRLLGEPSALSSASLQECEVVERQLKDALGKVDAKKVRTVYIVYIVIIYSI
jgi:hypothetical protein